MPIKKSAIKKAKQDLVKKARNKLIKISFRSKIKETKEAIAEGKIKEASQSLISAFSALDKAAKKNVIHKNTAARKKSRLAKKVADIKTGEKKAETPKKTKKTKKTTK